MKTPLQIALTIIEHIKQEEVLMACKSFSELHDHCDANVLGCVEEDFEALGTDFVAETKYYQLLQEAQDLVDSWLRVKDKTYFSLEVAVAMEAQNPIENAATVADLQDAIHDLKVLRLDHLRELHDEAQKAINSLGACNSTVRFVEARSGVAGTFVKLGLKFHT